MSLADFDLLFTDDPLFLKCLMESPASGAICLGAEAFTAISGLRGDIFDRRGYIYSPSSFKPIERRVFTQVGNYKTNRKLPDGTFVHRKGDPRMGWQKITQTLLFSPSLSWVIPTLDPRKIEEASMTTIPCLKIDLQRAARLRANPIPLLITISTIHTTPLGGSNLTIDIETVGFDGPIHRIGFSTDTQTSTIPWNYYNRTTTQSVIDASNCIQGHNLAFDIPRLEGDGISFRGKRRFDTMLAGLLLQPDLFKSLERMAPLYLDLQPWKHLSESEPEKYNAYDAFVTHRLADAQRIVLSQTNMLDLFENHIMPGTETLINMTRHGIRIDREQLDKWQKQLFIKELALLNEWRTYVGGVNCNSVPQLKSFLYKQQNLTPQFSRKQKQKKETLSVDEEAIRNLIQLHPEHSEMLSCLLTLKKVSKQKSTYAAVELGDDNSVHPRYLPSQRKYNIDRSSNVAGFASTGRIASNSPNVQNQTPESKLLFVPHYEGWTFLEFDFSQIELRIAAAQSEDKALLEALKGDVHARTMDIIGCDRVRAKNLIYGSLYGASAGKLVKVLRGKGIATTKSECEKLQSALARAYPRLWAWRTAIANEGLRRHFLTNPFDRRRYFYNANTVPEMYDYIPQSTAADILWRLLPQLEKFALDFGGYFLTTTHDSGLFEFPEINTDLCHYLRSICEQEWPQVGPNFHVPIKLKSGSNWGSLNPLPDSAI